jgi:hypothetical protein
MGNIGLSDELDGVGAFDSAANAIGKASKFIGR